MSFEGLTSINRFGGTHRSGSRVRDLPTIRHPDKGGFDRDQRLELPLRKHSVDVKYAVRAHRRQVGRVAGAKKKKNGEANRALSNECRLSI